MSKPQDVQVDLQRLKAPMPTKKTALTPKLPVITIVPDANPTIITVRRGPAALARQQALNSTTTTWTIGFSDCCCSVAPTYCCVVTCCPCTTIASVKESLGGTYEGTLLYYGGLAFGVLLCIGMASSSFSNSQTSDLKGGRPPPEESHEVGSAAMWSAAAFTFLLVFLVGVWSLRAQTRRNLGIQGSRMQDCLSSFLCCFCVISQLHLELKHHHEEPTTARHQQQQQRHRAQGNGTLANTYPVDILAPYAAM